MYEAQYRVLETKNGCGFIWRISRNLEGASNSGGSIRRNTVPKITFGGNFGTDLLHFCKEFVEIDAYGGSAFTGQTCKMLCAGVPRRNIDGPTYDELSHLALPTAGVSFPSPETRTRGLS